MAVIRKTLGASALCALAMSCIGEAQAVQLTESAYSHSLTVKFPGYTGSETLSDFPVLVRLPAGFDYASCQEGGADLRFADADGELLDSEIDTWNPSGESLVWVRVPQLKQGTIITAHYGSSSPDEITPGNVWDSNYVSVYHLGGDSLPLAESTGRGKPFSSGTGTVGFGAPGLMGGAVDFTQSGAFCNLVCEDDDNLDGLEDLTVEVWTKQDVVDTVNNRFLLTKRTAYNSDYSFAFYQVYNKNGAFAFCYTLDGTNVKWGNGNTVTVEPGAWTHTVYTRASAQCTFTAWRDAATTWTSTQSSNFPAGALWNSAMGLRLGGDTSSLNQMFPGQVDEIRISKIVRSDLWIRTSQAAAEPGFSEVCFGNDWSSYSHKINVKFSGYAGSTTLTDFPVLVRLSKDLNGFDYSACQIPNGGDLRFSDAAGNLLASEVDTWNTNGVSLVWVKVPSLNAATQIRAYYGCAAPGHANPRDVWSNGYEGVWHLGADGYLQRDSTTNGLDFTCRVVDLPKVTCGVSGGIIGKTVQFCVNEDKKGCLTASDPAGRLSGPDEKTYEFWAYQDHHDVTDVQWNGYYLYYLGDNGNQPFGSYEISGSGKNGRTVNQLYTIDENGTRLNNWMTCNNDMHPERAQWSYNAVRYATVPATETVAAKVAWNVFLDKRKYASTEKTFNLSNGIERVSGALNLGNSRYNWSGAYPGNIDELRISSVARSDDWLNATHDTIKNEQFASYEVEAAASEDWGLYARRFTVTFPDYAGGELTDFPVLVRVSTAAIPGFSYAECLVPNGGDLRFSDSVGNLLASEIDVWDEEGTSLIWVKVPSLTSSTVIYGYYGCETPAVTSAKDVWSNGFIGVWHLGESGMVMKDSSWKSADFTCSTANASKVGRGVDGLVGKAVQFDVAEDKKGALSAANSAAFDNLGAITLELWVNITAQDTANDRYIFSKWVTYDNDGSFVIYDRAGSTPKNRIQSAIFREGQPGKNSDSKINMYIDPLEAGGWHHQVFVYEKTDGSTANWASYGDKAKLSGTTAYNEGVRTGTAPMTLGNSTAASSGAFPGKIDEVRVSNVARSQDWVNATYDTITDTDFAHCSSVKDLTVRGLQIFIR